MDSSQLEAALTSIIATVSGKEGEIHGVQVSKRGEALINMSWDAFTEMLEGTPATHTDGARPIWTAVKDGVTYTAKQPASEVTVTERPVPARPVTPEPPADPGPPA